MKNRVYDKFLHFDTEVSDSIDIRIIDEINWKATINYIDIEFTEAFTCKTAYIALITNCDDIISNCETQNIRGYKHPLFPIRSPGLDPKVKTYIKGKFNHNTNLKFLVLDLNLNELAIDRLVLTLHLFEDDGSILFLN